MKDAGENNIYFEQDRIEELARFLHAIIFNGGNFTVENGPNFGWTVKIK
jgi:hypothetical protein